MRARSAPHRSIAAIVASSTPVAAPRQPAWAAPTTPACWSANSTGPQSAGVTPIARPGVRGTMASARGGAGGVGGCVLGTGTAIEAGIDAVGHAAVAGEEGVPDARERRERRSLKHACCCLVSRGAGRLSFGGHDRLVLADRSRLEAGE